MTPTPRSMQATAIMTALAIASGAALGQASQSAPAAPGGDAGTHGQTPMDAGSQAMALHDPAHDPWRVEFRAWAWLMGVEGDVGARGRITEVSASFGDILDGSDSIFAFSGRLEVGHGALGAFFDGMYADIGAENQTGTAGRAAVDIEFQQTILDFGLMYRVCDLQPEAPGPAANARNLTLDLYAGGRYVDLDVEIDPDRVASRHADRDWLDPILGAKAVFPIAEHWHVELNGDVGGFGASSDLTWSATAVIGYDFNMFGAPASVLLGYRVIGWDYTDGDGNDEFTWDLFQHGVILGLNIRFR